MTGGKKFFEESTRHLSTESKEAILPLLVHILRQPPVLHLVRAGLWLPYVEGMKNINCYQTETQLPTRSAWGTDWWEQNPEFIGEATMLTSNRRTLESPEWVFSVSSRRARSAKRQHLLHFSLSQHTRHTLPHRLPSTQSQINSGWRRSAQCY